MARLHQNLGSLVRWPALARVLSLLICTVSQSLAATAGADQGRLATPAELRQMHDEGQHRICLQQIGRIMRSSQVDKAYDRYDLLLLRGDCLLHLEDPATAQIAYASAAKSPVPEQAREGRATALLLQRAVKTTFVPRGGGGDSINIASKEGRIRALRELLQEELRASDADFRRATTAETLVPIFDVLPKLSDLYAIERTATGGDLKLRPVLEAIGQRARTLIDHELDLREQTTNAVGHKANQLVTGGGGWWWGGTGRRGLYSNDRRQLRDLIDYLRRVDVSARLGQQLASAFDADSKVWDPLVARTSRSLQRAQEVLDAE